LGSFTRNSNGWAYFGTRELKLDQYVNIIDAEDSWKKLYLRKGLLWTHISAPILFTVKKNENETFIAGWAGPKDLIETLKKTSTNPWDWKGLTPIEVDASAAIPSIKLVWKNTPKINLPVFFTSNGETNAEENWHRLKSVCPRAERIDGIWGRRNVFLECARSTEATHFFVVTAKNYVTDPTVFDYPLDSEFKVEHMVFLAKNMSNGLESGHMGIVCYNRMSVLNTPENFGLDFTQYTKTFTIPFVVSEARFATSAFEAWRTAFREVVKLTVQDPHPKNIHPAIHTWMNTAYGPNNMWVLLGAQHGHDYAMNHLDDEEGLLKTVDWKWLEKRFDEVRYI
jgi:hypothetical protein